MYTIAQVLPHSTTATWHLPCLVDRLCLTDSASRPALVTFLHTQKTSAAARDWPQPLSRCGSTLIPRFFAGRSWYYPSIASQLTGPGPRRILECAPAATFQRRAQSLRYTTVYTTSHHGQISWTLYNSPRYGSVVYNTLLKYPGVYCYSVHYTTYSCTLHTVVPVWVEH